jgi:hypothetical protein
VEEAQTQKQIIQMGLKVVLPYLTTFLLLEVEVVQEILLPRVGVLGVLGEVVQDFMGVPGDQEILQVLVQAKEAMEEQVALVGLEQEEEEVARAKQDQTDQATLEEQEAMAPQVR